MLRSKIIAGLWILLLSVFLYACANHSAKTNVLLTLDYRNLSDDQLILHYYDLEDQIERVERSTLSPRINLGLGLSRYGFNSGTSGGVGISSGVGSNHTADDLRQRRNEVKLEMQKRGISP